MCLLLHRIPPLRSLLRLLLLRYLLLLPFPLRMVVLLPLLRLLLPLLESNRKETVAFFIRGNKGVGVIPYCKCVLRGKCGLTPHFLHKNIHSLIFHAYPKLTLLLRCLLLLLL